MEFCQRAFNDARRSRLGHISLQNNGEVLIDLTILHFGMVAEYRGRDARVDGYTYLGVLYTRGNHAQKEDQMRTNIVIDDGLIQRAMRTTGLRTKRAVVEAGLQLLIQVKAQTGIRRLRGKIKWEGNLNEMRASRI